MFFRFLVAIMLNGSIPGLDEDDASFFNIEYHNNYKLVSDHRNNKTYCLVQCGTTTPAGLAADVEVYQVPVTNAAALETTVVPYLEVIYHCAKMKGSNGVEKKSFFVVC